MNLSAPRKLLILAGLALIVFAMTYGLWYALFAEHQALESMGGSLATGFTQAASRNLPAAHAAIEQYGNMKYEYVRHVDVHSHWGGLAMILIVLGVMFDRIAFSEQTKLYLAILLVAGSVLFPLGVVLQTVNGSAIPSGLAIAGSALVIIGLALVAVGFARERSVS